MATIASSPFNLYLPTRPHLSYLVEDDQRAEASLQRLAQHEFGLGQRPLVRVYQQQTAVHHSQYPAEWTVAKPKFMRRV